MSGIKKAIYDFLLSKTDLTDIIGQRLKPQLISMGKAAPYVIFERDTIEQVRHLGGVSLLKSDNFTFIAYANTQNEVETLKDTLNSLMDGLNRETWNGLSLILSDQGSESDDMDIRNIGEQEPAFNEVLSYTIWYRQT